MEYSNFLTSFMAIDIYGIGLSDILAISALVVSMSLFYVGHTRSKKSDQIRISREIWDRIENQEHIIEGWTIEDPVSRDEMKVVRAMNSLKNEMGYFVNLIEEGEIKEAFITEHYRKKLFDIYGTMHYINKQYPDAKQYSATQEILDLIRRYHDLTGKMKEYKEEFY
jgi:hypothetical protein